MQLYIIESGGNCKIGVTNDIARRLPAYSTHNADYRVAHKLDLPSEETARRIETAVRRKFASSQIGDGREWFAVPSHIMFGAVLQALSPIGPAASVGLQRVERTERAYELQAELASSFSPELRSAFAQHFSEVFGLGLHSSMINALDPRPRRIYAGVDHSAAMPGQCRVSGDRRSVDFPGQEFRQDFFDLLPLASGSQVAYCTAVASMPYLEEGSIPDLARSIDYAAAIGWSCTVHADWSWRPGDTQLVLYQRSQSRAQLRAQWDGALQKWVNEREKWIEAELIRRGLFPDVVNDLAGAQHLPLDVKDEADFLQRYWEPFVAPTFGRSNPEVLEANAAVIALWLASKP